MTNATPARGHRWLNALGLHRPELRAWAMYDWAVSAMQTVITTAVFPIYYMQVAGAGRTPEAAAQSLGYANTVAAIVIAVLAPILGAVADFKAAKKRFLVAFMLIGVVATSAMFFIDHGELVFASALFVLSIAGATGSMTFYEALLPHIASDEEIDRVSTAAYAIGYIGGGVLLAINLAWISSPENVPRTTLHSEEIPTAERNWSGQNMTGFRNAEMDAMLEAIPVELDRERRRVLWHRLQAIYAEQLPAIPLWFRSDAHVWPRWLDGVRPTGHLNASSNWVEEWRVR